MHTTYRMRAANATAAAAYATGRGPNPWQEVIDAVTQNPDPYEGLIDSDAEES